MSDAVTWRTRRVHSALWLRSIFLLTPFILIPFLPAAFAGADGEPWALVGATVVMVICFWPVAFAAHWIEAGSNGMRIRYWPILSRRIEFSQIASIQFRESVSPWEFAGIGLRLAPAGVLAFVNRKGPGVGIRLVDGRSYFVILADRDESVALQSRLAQARPDLVSRRTAAGEAVGRS